MLKKLYDEKLNENKMLVKQKKRYLLTLYPGMLRIAHTTAVAIKCCNKPI